MKQNYTPKWNPFSQLAKIASLCLFSAIPVCIIIHFANNKPVGWNIDGPDIFLIFFFSFLAVLIFVSLLSDFKTITFYDKSFKIIYLLKLQTKVYNNKDIMGFSKCVFNNGHNTTSLILYTKDQNKIEFVSKNYLGYVDLENYLHRHFKYLGVEHLTQSFWGKRYYKFE